MQKVASQGSLSLSPTKDNRKGAVTTEPKLTTQELEKDNKLIKEYVDYSINLDGSSNNEAS